MKAYACSIMLILFMGAMLYGGIGYAHAQTTPECAVDEVIESDEATGDLVCVKVSLESPFSLRYSPATYDGDSIKISGDVSDWFLEGAVVTIRILDPDDNNIDFGQNTPDENNKFTFTTVPGGQLWAKEGQYSVHAFYAGKHDRTLAFDYEGSGYAPIGTTCAADQDLIDGKCVDKVVECEDGQELRDGECVAVEPECKRGEELRDGECVAIEPECEDGEVLKDGECIKLPPPPPPPPTTPPTPTTPACGAGTELKNGQCVPIETEEKTGCLIATATYGTELAPQVQMLREIRDGQLLKTESGSAFIESFNSVYYSFAPTVSDWERENPVFKDAVRVAITPMITSLGIMSLADSESGVLALGLFVIALNLGMYVAAPAFVAFRVKRHFSS